MKKKFIFITEANAQKNISFGHFFRSFEISKILKKLGYKVYFHINQNKFSKKFLKQKKFFLFKDLKQILSLKDKKDYKIIVDLFKIERRFLKSLKNFYSLIVFDDFQKIKNLKSAKILNFNKYKSIKYFRILNIKKVRNANKNYLAINTGGSDLGRNHSKLIKKILKEKLNENIKIFFYVGPGIKKYKIYKKNIKNIFFIRDNNLFNNKAFKSKFIVSSGGISMFEYLFFKKKIFAIPTGDYEKLNIKNLIKKKYLLKFNFLKSFEDNFKLSKKIKNKKIIKIKKIKKDFREIFLN